MATVVPWPSTCSCEMLPPTSTGEKLSHAAPRLGCSISVLPPPDVHRGEELPWVPTRPTGAPPYAGTGSEEEVPWVGTHWCEPPW